MKLDKYEVGYNIPAKVGMNIKDVQTPSLVIDYNIFANNILKMKEFITNNKVKLRPHAKMHKSVDVANFQINNGGAHGICCQKVSEAEVFARNGIQDILITNQVTDLLKIDRLTKIDTKNCNISCCVDNKENNINIKTSAFENNYIINVYIESDCGANRSGLEYIK